ncbi:MAG: DUF3011 domain-containing protein [Candidatus Binatia bacterium]
MTATVRYVGLGLLALTAAMLGIVATAAAQGSHRPPSQHRPHEIRCESESRRSSYCPTYTQGRVRLQRQLSKTRCREYDTWGADRDGGGVWVWNGCRGIFAVQSWGVGPGPGAGPSYGYAPGPRRPVRITCRSDRFRPQYCPIPRWGRVELERRLSDAPCRRYDTWGSDGGGIWVDRGCAAIFSVR